MSAYMYILNTASGSSLEIVNIDDPVNPVHVSNLSLNYYSGNGFLRGNYMYVLSNTLDADPPGSNTLQIIDVSNVNNPQLASSNALSFKPGDCVVLEGDIAYIVSHHAIEAWDINNAINPTQLGYAEDGVNNVSIDNAKNTIALNNYIYTVNQDIDSLEVIDFNNLSNIQYKARLSHGDSGAIMQSPQGMTLRNSYLYICGADSDSIQIVSIGSDTNPNPTPLGNIVHDAGQGILLNYPGSIHIRNDYAFVPCYFGRTLTVLNVSDPNNPTHVKSVSVGEGGAVLYYPTYGRIYGDYLYLNDYWGSGLEIFDISDPTNPTHVKYISDGDGGITLTNCWNFFVKPTVSNISSSHVYVGDTVTMDSKYFYLPLKSCTLSGDDATISSYNDTQTSITVPRTITGPKNMVLTDYTGRSYTKNNAFTVIQDEPDHSVSEPTGKSSTSAYNVTTTTRSNSVSGEIRTYLQ